MCNPVIAAAAVSVAGALIQSANQPSMPAAPKALTPTSPEAPAQPQAAKMPDQEAVRKKAQQAAGGGGSGGRNNTMLTGPLGVPLSSLNLGQSTLLGQ